ncbi:MAG TPA: 2-succinyl-5-enolpyruvyl-6-hydroxy-3-cyclohexene-1-carboxylic-acid synthase [Acidimicrobiales bacterium]|nr:2-succinyl-5-enolpyruvyl-6-hydroxy-3-cyclohexene-1-carboxylic-acid synthase [Acidimicrobiales bacterium]
MTVQATFAATLTDEFVRAGVTDAVVCPGSRSTPLALAMAAAGQGRLRLHVVVDERSAGFFAVGLARATGRPPVLVTTSGTAAVELHPAVVEASQDGVPLVVCTADRPPELHLVGAPQTVEQARLFGDAVRWFFEPGLPDAAASAAWRSMASRAVAEAVGGAGPGGPGPVHLNLAFRDPLVAEPGELPPGREDGGPWHRVDGRSFEQAPIPDGARGVLVAGGGAGDPAAVSGLAEALGWPLLADPRSGCRVPSRATVAAADGILRTRSFQPDIVVRFGGPWASKVVNQWLGGCGAEQWLVDPHGRWRDPERVVSRVVGGVVPGKAAPAGWLDEWAAAEDAAQAAFDRVLARHPEPTEPGLARTLLASVPDGSAVVVSSSMPVRDVEWYARPRDGVRVLANRGANGIDGVLSTALGVAAGAGGPTFALVGDLAFVHDVGALGLAARRPDLACTFVVVDNDGGGIFSFLPQARALAAERFEALFGTPHGLDLAAVAGGFGLPVVPLDEALAAAASPGPRVVHVRTDRAANVAVHDELHAAVAAALA